MPAVSSRKRSRSVVTASLARTARCWEAPKSPTALNWPLCRQLLRPLIRSPLSGSPPISRVLELATAVGYLVVGYVAATAVAGMLFVKYAVEAVGATVPSIASILLAQRRACPSFVAVALAIYFVIPASTLPWSCCKRPAGQRLAAAGGREP